MFEIGIVNQENVFTKGWTIKDFTNLADQITLSLKNLMWKS